MKQFGIDTVEQSSKNVFEQKGIDVLKTQENVWYEGMEDDD